MSDYTQATVEVLAHQELTHPGSIVPTPVSVASYLSGNLYVYQANIETTANLGAGLDYIDVQVSPDASGNNWASLRKLVPSITAAETELLTATEPIGETVMAMASTTNLDASDLVYIKDDTSVATSEWHQVVSIVANTSITLADGLAVEKVANDDVFDQASRWVVGMDFAGVSRIRLVVVHQGATGSDWRVYAVLTAATDME